MTEYILMVIGIILFCVAFYAYLSEPVSKAVKEAEDAGYIIRRPVYECSEPSPMSLSEVYWMGPGGLPQSSPPSGGIIYAESYPETEVSFKAPLITIGDAPKLPKKPRKAAKKTVKKVAKKAAKKKPNSTRRT